MCGHIYTTCVCVCVCTYVVVGQKLGGEREREDELEDYGQLSELSM